MWPLPAARLFEMIRMRAVLATSGYRKNTLDGETPNADLDVPLNVRYWG